MFLRNNSDCKRYVEIYELTYDEAAEWTKKHLPPNAYYFYFVQYKTETNKWIQHYEEAKEKWKIEWP